MNIILKKFVSLAVLMAAAAVPALSQDLLPVRVSEVSAIAPYWPSFIAQEKGLYEKHGVAVAVTLVGSPATSAQQLVAGAFDFSSTTFDTALRLAASGAPISFVGATSGKYAHSVLADPSIKSAADLKGKTVSLSFEKDLTTSMWKQWLESQKVNPADVDLIFDGSTVNRFAALTAKRVHAAMLSQPFDIRAQNEGMTKLVDLGAFQPNFIFLGYIAQGEWMKANPEAAKGFLAAQSEAIDWFYDTANREEAIDILVKVTKQDRALAEANYDYYATELKPFSVKLRIPEKAAAFETEELARLGEIPSASAIPATFVDLSYAPQ